jgi:hypothetical protein
LTTVLKAKEDIGKHIVELGRLKEARNIDRLFEAHNEYARFLKVTIDYDYLKDITEDIIYETYMDVIRKDH